MTKSLNFALKIKGGREGGTCEVLRPCHPPKFGTCTCSFLIETSQKFSNEKMFLCLKIAEIGMGGQFWVEKNDFGHKNSFFFKI